MGINKPICTITLYDYNKNPVCDLYNSQSDPMGQACEIVLQIESSGWKTLSFNIPDNIDGESNYRIDDIKGLMLVKLTVDGAIDWFIISLNNISHKKYQKSYECLCDHISRLLKVRGLSLTLLDETGEGNGIGTCSQLLLRILSGTGWSVGAVDSFYEKDGVTLKIRTITSKSGTGAYKNIQTLCSTFEAKPTFNGNNNTVDIHILNPYAKTTAGTTDILPDEMILLHYGVALDSVSRKQSTDNLCTSLSLQGQYSSDTGYTTISTMNRRRFHSYPSSDMLPGTYYTAIDDGNYKIWFTITDTITAGTLLIYDTFDPASRLYILVGESNYVRVKRERPLAESIENYTDEWILMDELKLAWTNAVMSFDYFDDIGVLTDEQVLAIAKYNDKYPLSAAEYSEAYSKVLSDQTILANLGLTTDDNYVIFKMKYGTAGEDGKSFTFDLNDLHIYYHTELKSTTTAKWRPGIYDVSGSDVDWVYIFHPTYLNGLMTKCDYSKTYIPNKISLELSGIYTISVLTGITSDANNGRYCYEFVQEDPLIVNFYGVTEKNPTTTPITGADDLIILIVSKNTSAHTAMVLSTLLSGFKTVKEKTDRIKWQVTTPAILALRWWFNPSTLELKYCEGTQWMDLLDLLPTMTSDDFSVYRQMFQTIWKACESIVRNCGSSARYYTFTSSQSLPAGPYGILNHDRINYVQAVNDLSSGDSIKFYAPSDYYTSNVWKAALVNINTDGTETTTSLDYSSVDKDSNDVLPWLMGLSKQIYSGGLTPPKNYNWYFVTNLPYNSSGYKSIKLITSDALYRMTFRSRTVYGGIVYWLAADTYSRYDSAGNKLTSSSSYNKIDCKAYTCVPNEGITITDSKIPFVLGESLQFSVVAYTLNNYLGTAISIASNNNWILQNDRAIIYLGLIYSLSKSWRVLADTAFSMYLTDNPAVLAAKLDMDEVKGEMTDALGWLYRLGIWSDTSYALDAVDGFYSDGLDNLKLISKPETLYTVSIANLYGTDEADCLMLGDTPIADWRLIDINDCIHVIDLLVGFNFYSYVTKIKRYFDLPSKDSITISQLLNDFSGHTLTDTLSRINLLASSLDANQTIYERASIISSGGQIAADVLNGVMDAAKTKISASNGTCYTDDNGNMVFESYDGSGAMTINGSGFMIANGKNADGTWNWRTFGTGDGFTADLITAGLLQAGKIRILGTDQFYWDADNIYIFDATDSNKQIRIGRYDGVNYGIGFTTDGGTTWHSAIGFNSVLLSSLSESSRLKIDDDGITLKTGTEESGSGTMTVNSGASINISSGGSINIDAGGLLNVSASSIKMSTGGTSTLQDKLDSMEDEIAEAASSTGKDGYSQAMVSLYIRSALSPSVPSSTCTYAFSTAKISGTLSGWSQSIPSYNGNPLWQTTCNVASKLATVSITSGMWNAPSCIAKDGLEGQPGQQGLQGASVSNIINYYLTNNLSSGVTRETSGWTTNILQVSSSKKYLWNYLHIVYSDTSKNQDTDPVILSIYSESGKGIKTLVLEYGTSTSQDVLPTTWSGSMPLMSLTNKYLWNKLTISYTDGSSNDVFKTIIAVYGDKGLKGDDGNSITAIANYYLASTKSSGVSRTDSGWTTTMQYPTLDTRYLWNYESISYSDTTDSYTLPTIIGVFGLKGDGGRGITNILLYYGTSTSQIDKPLSWSSDIPTITSVNKYMWNRLIVNYSSGTPASLTFDNIIAVYGDKGLQGDTGVSITSVVPIHYLGTSEPSVPTLEVTSTSTNVKIWTTVIPTYISGYTYYTCNQNKFSNGTITWLGLRLNPDAKSAALAAIDASDAKSTADSANTTAQLAKSTADTANTNSQTAIDTANSNTSLINSTKNLLLEADSKLENKISSNLGSISNLTTVVNNNSLTIMLQSSITNYVTQIIKPAVDSLIGLTADNFKAFITQTKTTAANYSILSLAINNLNGTSEKIYTYFDFSTLGLRISASKDSDYWIKIDNTGIYIMYKQTLISAFRKDTLTTPNVLMAQVSGTSNVNYSIRPAPDGGVMFVMD